MSNQRGIHWKRRAIRQIITLGTIPSLFAGALLANPPSPPGLPGLPSAESAALSTSDRPKLLPIPETRPGSSLRPSSSSSAPLNSLPTGSANLAGTSAVNITILPSLPPAGALPASAPATPEFATSAVQSQSKGSVLVKMDANASDPKPSATLPPPPTNRNGLSHAVAATAPMTIENGKPVGSGPVKLSIGDNGIVDLGVQRPRQDAVVNSRAPELVKPKKYSVAQPVVLAQAAEIQANDDTGSSLPTIQNGTEPRLTEPSLPAPAVATGLPLSIQTEQPQTAATPSVTAVAASKPEPVAQPSPPRVAATQGEAALRQYAVRGKPEKAYDIETRGTYLIDVPFVIASAVSLDSDVCTVFNNGKSITIAGGSTGNTRVAIVSQSGEARLIEVNVLPVGQQFSRPQSDIDQVKELIGKVFPDARVQIVSLPTGEVEVKGTTSNESDARKILELVRKVCLVPVHDRLKSGR